jgi:cellulose synthase/poly-beta-1,6-N-acetylglucosamine synthase-like glycosyltransferase
MRAANTSRTGVNFKQLRRATKVDPLSEAYCAKGGFTEPQKKLITLLGLVLGVGVFDFPQLIISGGYALVFGGIGFVALLRLTALKHPGQVIAPLTTSLISMPFYSVICPLYDEAAMAPQLVAAMSRLDYPLDRLEVIFVLELNDFATAEAFRRCKLPPHMRVLTAPDKQPRTKPRACTYALSRSRGDLVVVYDAEDEPDPLQLKEAAQRFAEAPDYVACLQAPLRIRPRDDFIGRMFTAEFAALFDVMLPMLALRGGVFPLGGTSNHFRREPLAALGGWDVYNVTEDADLGFRFAAHGLRCGLLTRPTWETAPRRLKDWLPQRARWLKGYMQSLAVHTRQPLAGGWRPFVTLIATLGVAIGSAILHGFCAVGLGVLAIKLAAGVFPRQTISCELAIGVIGYAAAISNLWLGLTRIGQRFTWRYAVEAPVYWGLQSLAALYAMHQIIHRPHHWDKTAHEPEAPLERGRGADPTRSCRAA